MGESLKRCAHCEGEAELDTMRAYCAVPSGRLGHAVAIYCLECGIETSVCREDHSGLDDEALVHMVTETWNRRPQGETNG